MYDNPVTILRERAPTGDLYTVSQKKKTVSYSFCISVKKRISLTTNCSKYLLRLLKAKKKMVQKQKVNYFYEE